LAERYLDKFVTCLDVKTNNDLKIINKNQSIFIICDDKIIGAVIRDAAKKDIANYFGHKLTVTVKAHYKINHEKTHASSGTMVSYNSYAKFLDLKESTIYLYKKDLNFDPHKQKIYDEDDDSFRKWLYENAYNYLC